MRLKEPGVKFPKLELGNSSVVSSLSDCTILDTSNTSNSLHLWVYVSLLFEMGNQDFND